jgi:MFS transporter, DHA2 family, multidrug resistance protein
MNTAATDSRDDQNPAINPYFSIFILTLATFMQVVDSSIVNVSLTKIAGDLSVSPDEAFWAIGSYLIATAAILPISGWLATFFGRKNYYLACALLFTVSSVLCGLAANFEQLIVFRILQGACGAGLAPSEQAIIADITPPEKLGRAFSIYAGAIAIGPVLGPTLGGFITDTFGWRWIFFINLPVGIVSVLLTWLFVHETKRAAEARANFRKSGKRIDWLGILLFITGIAALELLLEKGPKEGWFESDFIVVLALAAFFALLIGITWEWYHKQPAVDVSMFKNRSFAGATVLIFVVGFVLTGSSFLTPYMAQTLLGYTAMDAGMISLPGTLVQLLGIQLVGYLSDKIEIRKIIFFGLIFSTLAVWNLASFNLNVDFYTLAFARAMQLFGLSFLAVTINTAAYIGLPPEKNNSASALLNLSRNMGASFGVALTSTVIALQTPVHINNFGYYTNEFNQNYVARVNYLTEYFQQQGIGALQAAGMAQSMIWQEVVRQASMKAILDAIGVYFILFILVLPLVFLLKRKPKTAGNNH